MIHDGFFVLIILLTGLFFIVRKKQGNEPNNYYQKFQSELSITCSKKVESIQAFELLRQSASCPKIHKILNACDVSRHGNKQYLLESTYSVSESTGKLAVVVIKTNSNFPFFYLYSTASDYDNYSHEIYDQFRIQIDHKEVRVATHKGAGIEVHQMIQKELGIAELLKILDGTGVDIEFSNNNIYIWDYFNDDDNVKDGQLARLLRATDIAQNYLRPKLEYLANDFKHIANAYRK